MLKMKHRYELNFYPRPPRGGRLGGAKASYHCKDFYPRPPRGGRQDGDEDTGVGPQISIHALREEGDDVIVKRYIRITDFYPRPPRGGRLRGHHAAVPLHDISIHALREEGDDADDGCAAVVGISIHALREEGDFQRMSKTRTDIQFLSTPSARRATVEQVGRALVGDISTHALREEGDC